jgi:hypothetical protein
MNQKERTATGAKRRWTDWMQFQFSVKGGGVAEVNAERMLDVAADLIGLRQPHFAKATRGRGCRSHFF